jgi:hypothetical protein
MPKGQLLYVRFYASQSSGKKRNVALQKIPLADRPRFLVAARSIRSHFRKHPTEQWLLSYDEAWRAYDADDDWQSTSSVLIAVFDGSPRVCPPSPPHDVNCIGCVMRAQQKALEAATAANTRAESVLKDL